MKRQGTRLKQIEERLRGSLPNWDSTLTSIASDFQNIAKNPVGFAPATLTSYATRLARIAGEMSTAEGELSVITQDLTAAKADAEYREVLVRAWPTNHFLDRLTYLGAAVLGAGGAAYVLVGREVSFLFWAIGGALMAWGLAGLARWERKKWNFYADQFSVDEDYRP